jgi:GntR family transcriptional regulator of arabinose operon
MKTTEQPLYLQIYQALKNRIESDEWSFGAMLPSEIELSEVYKISRGTVRKVLAALEEDGLVRREQGRGTFISRPQDQMKNSHMSTQSVAFIVPYVRDSFVSSILLGLESVIRKNGYTVLFHHVENDKEKQQIVLRQSSQQGISGIVLYPVDSNAISPILRELIQDEFPIVLVDRYIRGLYCDYVASDNYTGGLFATQHLLSLGHQRIAFLSWFDLATTMEHRRLGYRQALLEQGIEPEPTLEWEVVGYPGIDIAALEKYLLEPNRPTAIFVANDQLAISVLTVARSLDISIPEDLALVGFDNLDISAHLDIPLTTIAQPSFDIGYTAGELLISQIKKETSWTQRRILPVQLIVRRSCGAIKH